MLEKLKEAGLSVLFYLIMFVVVVVILLVMCIVGLIGLIVDAYSWLWHGQPARDPWFDSGID